MDFPEETALSLPDVKLRFRKVPSELTMDQAGLGHHFNVHASRERIQDNDLQAELNQAAKAEDLQATENSSSHVPRPR